MDQYLKILKVIDNKQLPRSFDVGSKELDIVLSLIDEGLISAMVQPIYGSTIVNSPRLTIKGDEKLKTSKVSAKIISAFHNVSFGLWKYILSIIAGILIGLLVRNQSLVDSLLR